MKIEHNTFPIDGTEEERMKWAENLLNPDGNLTEYRTTCSQCGIMRRLEKKDQKLFCRECGADETKFHE